MDRMAAKSSWWMADTAYRRARPVYSTTPVVARRACLAAVLSRALSVPQITGVPVRQQHPRCAGRLGRMRGDSDKSSVERAYARWAPVYDLVFGAVFDAGRRAAIVAAEDAGGSGGGRILEVGVGTGISLPDYARNNRLVGIDLSEPMLRKAKDKVTEHKLDNVEALAVMDVNHLGFADNF